MKIRYDKGRGRVVPDNGIQELLSKYGSELKQMRMAAPRKLPFRSQEAPLPSPAKEAPSPKESPIQKYRRMVEELMREGFSYRDAVSEIDRLEPTLRQRFNELSTLKTGLGKQEAVEQVKARRKALAAKREAFTKQGRRW